MADPSFSDTPGLSHGPTPTASVRCLLLATDTHGCPDSLSRYARFLIDLHRRADPGGGGEAGPPGWIPIWARAGTGARPVFVAVPWTVRTVRVEPSDRAARKTLLRRAGDVGVDALTVGDRALARFLVRQAPRSVWFVPDGAEAAIRRVIVPVDFSPRAADSLRVAATLARLSGAECVALNAYRVGATVTGFGCRALTAEAARAAFDRFLRPIDTLGVTVTPWLREGTDVSRVVAEAAAGRQGDLLILASRGRSWPATLLGPTVAEQAVSSSRVPVLVVKHFGAARGLLGVVADRLRSRGNDLQCN